MTDLTPEKRAEFTDEEVEAVAKALFATEEPDRNAWRWSKPNPDDPAGPLAWHGYWLDAARAALVPLTAVKAAADERDWLQTVVGRLGRVNGEYAMEIHRCREALGVDGDTDPHHAAQALAAAVERVRALHRRSAFGYCRECEPNTAHPCPTLRSLDGTDE